LRLARAAFELPSLPSLRGLRLALPRAPSLQALRAVRHGAPAGPVLGAAAAIGVVSLITLANIFGARANLHNIGALFMRHQSAGEFLMHPLRLLRAATAKLPISNETWYKLLARPAWAPALSSSRTAWTVTRVFVALALYRLLTASTRGRGPLRLQALKTFAVQMVMGATCALWTLAFRSTALGLAHHILACFTITACVAAFGKFDLLSGILMLPLAAMIALETVEQAGVTYLN
jgi:tryptophan-rich sensory protein